MCEESVLSGNMKRNPLKDFVVGDMCDKNYDFVDLHKNHVDQIVLTGKNGEPMYRRLMLLMFGLILALCHMLSGIILLKIKS